MTGIPATTQLDVPTVHALTSPAHALVDREDERSLARSAVLDNGIRLLTLIGPPGVGTSRLAAAVAQELAPNFPDGAWWVECADVHEVQAIPSAILQILGLSSNPSGPSVARLGQRLENQHMVLILDNVEHVREAAVLISDLLAAHPGLCVITTSRQPLHVKWEHVLAISPLAFVRDPSESSLDQLEVLPSVQLFVQHAQAKRLDFTVTPDNLPDIAAICAWAEGVPLVIELAAGWTSLLPPSAILDYLTHLDFLYSTAHDAPARQQSLTAALDWSYTLLSDAEQRLLRRISVFADGFSLDGAAALMDKDGPGGLDTLSSLVDKSLVQVQNNEGGEVRFRLLIPVRAYAQEQLVQSGELEETQERHAQYVLALAEQIGQRARYVGLLFAPRESPPAENWNPGASRSSLKHEYANLVAALRWFRAASKGRQELLLAYAVAPYWSASAHAEEAAEWLKGGLARNPEAEPELRAGALNRLSLVLVELGQLLPARQVLDESVTIARSLGNGPLLGDTLINLAAVLRGLSDGNLPEARLLVEEALPLYTESDDAWGRGIARLYLGIFDLFSDAGERAREPLADALSTFRQLEDHRTSAAVLFLLGHVAWLRRDTAEAYSTIVEGIRLSQGIDDPRMIASVADLVAWLLRDERPRQAAMLAGAYEGMVERGVVRAGNNHALQSNTLERLKDRIPESELQAELQNGRSWSLEETTDNLLAILEGGEVPAPPFEAPEEQDPNQQLNEREVDVLRLLSEGLSTTEIAQTIFVSPGTVKLDLRSIYRKLKVQNRAHAMAVAAERGLI